MRQASDGRQCPPPFVSAGQLEISQTRRVWFANPNEIRPEGTADSSVPSGRKNLTVTLPATS